MRGLASLDDHPMSSSLQTWGPTDQFKAYQNQGRQYLVLQIARKLTVAERIRVAGYLSLDGLALGTIQAHVGRSFFTAIAYESAGGQCHFQPQGRNQTLKLIGP